MLNMAYSYAKGGFNVHLNTIDFDWWLINRQYEARVSNRYPLAVVYTRAKTLEGINAAIERATGWENYFESMEEFHKQAFEGWVHMCSDGFILIAEGR